MASPLMKERSEERINMEEDQWSYALEHPGYGQTPSDSGSEGEGTEVGRNPFGILSGGRPVRLVLYERQQVDNTFTIWIDSKSTYSDVANELTKIVANGTFVMLQPIWGPLPCWIEANPESLIETTCHTLYVVLKSESVGYILGVVRTSLSDYPIAIFEGPLDPSATVSEAVVASHPKLSDQIKSITSFADNQVIKDTQGGYDSLRQYASSRASVVIVVMTVDEPPTQFMSDLSDESIPPLLQVSFAYCKCLMQQGHDQDFFALQIIHLLRAILHTIISMALMTENIFEDDSPDVETPLHAKGDIADLLRVAPLLSHKLQNLLRELNGIMETLEGGQFDADVIRMRLDNTFHAVCADYPGAVTTRRSYGLFKRLGLIDHEEMHIAFARDVADQPVPNPNMGNIGERLEESKTKRVPSPHGTRSMFLFDSDPNTSNPPSYMISDREESQFNVASLMSIDENLHMTYPQADDPLHQRARADFQQTPVYFKNFMSLSMDTNEQSQYMPLKLEHDLGLQLLSPGLEITSLTSDWSFEQSQAHSKPIGNPPTDEFHRLGASLSNSLPPQQHSYRSPSYDRAAATIDSPGASFIGPVTKDFLPHQEQAALNIVKYKNAHPDTVIPASFITPDLAEVQDRRGWCLLGNCGVDRAKQRLNPDYDPSKDTTRKRLDHLYDHIRDKHFNNRPFRCAMVPCAQTFSREHDLKRHEKTHTVVSLPCDVCGKHYTLEDNLRRHMQLKHQSAPGTSRGLGSASFLY